MRYFLYLLFFWAVFFPYIQIFPIETDVQPNALLLSIALFFTVKKKLNFVEVLILLVFFVAVLVLAISDINFLTARSFFNYASLFLISFVSFRVLKSNLINFENFLKVVILIWFIVSAIQSLFFKEFLNFLLPSSRTTEDRGVVGLATEPTFLGIIFIFFILFMLHIDMKNKKIYIALCVIGIIFFAKSSMGFLFLAILYFIYFITHATFKKLLIFAGITFFSFYTILNLNIGRVTFLLGRVLQNPSDIFFYDASLNDRFYHIYISLQGFFENFFLPHGYSAWIAYAMSTINGNSNIISFSLGGRIMSGYGAAFFELGFVAITIPIALIFSLYRLYSNNLKDFILHSFFINMIMFSAIPLSFPLFSFYIGFLNFLAWQKNRIQIFN